MAFFSPMHSALRPHQRTISYWDAQARWQKLWLRHTDYHGQLLAFLKQQVRPGWRVLDVGAGTGVLALPLQAAGCRVTVLEPSRGMREILAQECRRTGIWPERVESRCWEEVPLGELKDFDLILACNSLHLCSWGLKKALRKVFAAGPDHVCLITEFSLRGERLGPAPAAYQLHGRRAFTCDSSMAYHHVAEVLEHLRLRLNRRPSAAEVAQVCRQLSFRNDHLWLKSSATVHLLWWQKEEVFQGGIHEGQNTGDDFFGMAAARTCEPGTGPTGRAGNLRGEKDPGALPAGGD